MNKTMNPEWTFDTFVVGAGNARAVSAAKDVAHAPGSRHNPLLIHGATGLGCTHLLQAIGHHIMTSDRASLKYVSSEAMHDDYIKAVQSRTLMQFADTYRSVDVLLIDDIQLFACKMIMQDEFWRLFNDILVAPKQVVITSDRSVDTMPGLDQHCILRYWCSMSVQIKPPDLATRIAILRLKLKLMRCTFPDECLLYIVRYYQSNIRHMEGALNTAVTYASLQEQAMTIADLKHLLQHW